MITDAILASNLMLESDRTGSMPPANLQGWIAMPNGFLIGFDKPVAGKRRQQHLHVGGVPLACLAGGIQVRHRDADRRAGHPRPDLRRLHAGLPGDGDRVEAGDLLLHQGDGRRAMPGRGSIVSTPQGVIYASQNGLIMVGPAASRTSPRS